MTWIKTISYNESTGKLRQVYDRLTGPKEYLDNIITIHSLRPHSLEGHMKLYKNILHHTGNSLDKSILEMLGVYVSFLNDCTYCIEHYFVGLKRLLKNDSRAQKIKEAFEQDNLDGNFSQLELSLLRYAKILTLTPQETNESLISDMRSKGLTDGEILEVNQVISYFNYANRTVLGLGVTTKGDILGLSPGESEDPDNWTHQ
jgi:uncharacterized peroxidase-related enzyme